MLNNATGVNGYLGTYLEELYLKKLKLPYEHAEWHAITGHSASLEKLCKNLDVDMDKKQDWWINKFSDKAAIDKIFDNVFS